MASSMTVTAVECCLSVLVVLVLLSSGQVTWETTVVVSPKGIDETQCGTSSQPCRSLDFVLNQTGFNSTTILMKSGSFNYSSERNITEANFFAIMGETGDSQDVLISCQGNASLAFLLSSNVLLQGITLRNCGGLQRTTLYSSQMGQLFPDFSAALFFIDCWNVRLFNVEISDTSGIGVFMFNVGGIVNISHAVFANNRDRVNSRKRSSSGGFYVELNSDKFITSDVGLSTRSMNKNIYFFENCSFIGNALPFMKFSGSERSIRGGGLNVLLGGNATTNSFIISECQFLRNGANMGGGLHIEMREMAQNNTLRVQNSVFWRNFVNFAGGGVRLENSIETEKALLFNTFSAINCSFVKNIAQTGGGVSVHGTTRPIPQRGKHYSADYYVMAVFENCDWRENIALAAAAIGAHLLNLNQHGVGPLSPFHIVCVGCSIEENIIFFSTDEVFPTLIGQGIIYTVQVPVVFQGNTSLIKNSGTALVLESSALEVHDTVLFANNTGYRGGAVAMYGLSTIMLTRNSQLVFLGNRASERGGAMFISRLGSPFAFYEATGSALQSCFFTYEERGVDFDYWQTEIVFANNSVFLAPLGNSVYATSLKDCRRPGETRHNNTVFKWKIVRFEGQGNVENEVSTDPIDIQYRARDWNVSPNECFNATVLLIDEVNTSVYGIVNIRVQGENEKVNLATSSSFFLANERVENIRLTGKPKSRFNVILQTFGEQIALIQVKNLSLRDCNPGFLFNADSCVCGVSQFNGISRCGENGRDVYVRNGFWAGIVDGTFVTYRCPEGYCTTCDEPNGCLYTPGKICNGHRRGILCGSCEPGYTVLLGSEKCSRDCSNFYLLLFLSCAGMILFLVVMLIILLNVDVFTGTLNAWLYSYQVMHLLARDDTVFDPFIQFIIGLCNLQIKLGICIMQGLDDADKLAFLYIFPYATMVFVFILGRLVRNYPNCWFSRRVKAPFRAVCTVFVLCYTDLTMISLKILNPAHLGGRTVLFQEGNMGFFEGKHIAYGILAIFSMMVIVIPFPLTLMFTPFFTKRLRPVLNLNNFKPYYDAFQGCLEDRYRWCSAFYFVARFYLLVVDTYVSDGFAKQVLVEAVCVFILTVYVYLHPYKEEYNWINKLDAVLLTNLSLIAMLNAGIDSRDPSINRKATVLMLRILSYTPLGYLLVLLGVVWYKRYFSIENGLAVQGYISAVSSSSTVNQADPIPCDEREDPR